MNQYLLKIKNLNNQQIYHGWAQNEENRRFLILNNQKYKILSHILRLDEVSHLISNTEKRRKSQGSYKDRVKINKNQVVVNFSQLKIDKQIIRKVQNFSEGKEIRVNRCEEVLKLVEIARVSGIEQILDSVRIDILLNSQQYDFFTLFFLSQELGMRNLEKKCQKQLIKYEFEQMNFNLYDLLQCNFSNFIKILRLHKDFVRRRMCRGQSNSVLSQIINQYCLANGVVIYANDFFPEYLEQIKEEDETQELDEQQISYSSPTSYNNCKKILQTRVFDYRTPHLLIN